jgi:hypothetical protein
MVIGVLAAGIISEFTFRIQGNTYSRDPQTIELVIPAGTSENVTQGKNLFPASQDFVVGDTLLVKNEDSVTQTLGPLVIPPGSSASMKLNQAGNTSYTCSFQPSKQYGITVQQAITFSMRIQASLLAGLPLGMLVGVYSLIVKPVKPKVTSPGV